MGDKNVDMESYKYNYLMFTTERVSYVIQPWFVFFLGYHLLRFRHGLKCDSLHILVCVSTSMREFLVVNRMYRSSYVLLIR